MLLGHRLHLSLLLLVEECHGVVVEVNPVVEVSHPKQVVEFVCHVKSRRTDRPHRLIQDLLAVIVARSKLVCVRRQVGRHDAYGGVVDAELGDESALVSQDATNARARACCLHRVDWRPLVGLLGLEHMLARIDCQALFPQHNMRCNPPLSGRATETRVDHRVPDASCRLQTRIFCRSIPHADQTTRVGQSRAALHGCRAVSHKSSGIVAALLRRLGRHDGGYERGKFLSDCSFDFPDDLGKFLSDRSFDVPDGYFPQRVADFLSPWMSTRGAAPRQIRLDLLIFIGGLCIVLEVYRHFIRVSIFESRHAWRQQVWSGLL
mmetsp:Transcript_48198/g.142499  ORF Transcript_48198/g.142499 Transcript_48198/m.142499 type:complete len:320 (+) Transcript_48198:1786-2745(+)